MQTFQEQLAATRANLERLEALAAKHPELFEYAHLISVCPDQSTVYIHAKYAPERDWRALAMKHKAGWERKRSAGYGYSWFDWDGNLDGIRICILGVEPDEKARPLFADCVHHLDGDPDNHDIANLRVQKAGEAAA